VLIRWLLDGVLGGGRHPDPYGDRRELAASLDDLRAAGVTAIVSVCETPLELPDESGFDYLHCPTEDGAPPTDLDGICRFIAAREASASGTYVHCWAGIGRTGTVLAAYLMYSRGLTSTEAITRVRAEYHPSAVETRRQVHALDGFSPRPAHGR
jgi:atypical dual specificity phosphatase